MEDAIWYKAIDSWVPICATCNTAATVPIYVLLRFITVAFVGQSYIQLPCI